MGTTYSVITFGPADDGLKAFCDSVLVAVNASLSTYIPTSTISRINACSDSCLVDDHFQRVYKVSQQVFQASEGLFDPTVMPLVNAWGFGYEEIKQPPDSSMIDSLSELVGFDRSSVEEGILIKQAPELSFDFGGVAKGYGVDVLLGALKERGFENVLVEIGGEISCSGLKPDEQPWRVSIEKPVADPTGNSREVQMNIELSDASMASSGNYRNFYLHEGNVIAHEIDPRTGFPLLGEVLAVTVVSDKCSVADAWATALMLCTAEKAIELAVKAVEIEVLVIYEESGELKTKATEGFPKALE